MTRSGGNANKIAHFSLLGCVRCEKKGLSCPGYQPAKLLELFESPIFDSEQHKQSHSTFIEKGSELFVISSQHCRPFWLQVMAQLAYVSSPVRHGIAAVGAVLMLESSKASSAVTCTNIPAIPDLIRRHRAKEMQELCTNDQELLPTEVVLTTIKLLMMLDIWTGLHQRLNVHIAAAYKLIQTHCEGHKRRGERLSREMTELFVPAVEFTTVHAIAVLDNFPPPDSGIPTNYGPLINLDALATISNFFDAVYHLELIIKAIARFSFGHHAPGIEDNIITALSTYQSRLTYLYMDSRSDANPSLDPLAESYLSAHHRTAYLMFQSALYTSEAQFAVHTDDLRHILNNIQAWLAGDGLPSPDDHQRTLGVLPPLFFVATKSREADLRRKAIALMHDTRRLERSWTGCIAAQLARFVADTEQQAGRFVRLDKVDLVLTERRTRVRYWESGVNGAGEKKETSLICLREREVNEPLMDPLSWKVLKAYGYNATLPTAPQMDCHCPDGMEVVSRLSMDNDPLKIALLQTRADAWVPRRKGSIEIVAV